MMTLTLPEGVVMESIPLRAHEVAAYAAGKCTCLFSNTATSATIHNADPNCPVHGQGVTK